MEKKYRIYGQTFGTEADAVDSAKRKLSELIKRFLKDKDREVMSLTKGISNINTLKQVQYMEHEVIKFMMKTTNKNIIINNVYNGVECLPTYPEDIPLAQEVLSRCDMSQKPEDIYHFLKKESEKVGIRPEIHIYRSKTMQHIRHGRVIYGLLMLNYGNVEEGIKFIEKFADLDNLPIKIDKGNEKIIINDEGIEREYKFSETIFVEDFS